MFVGCASLTALTIPEGVERLEDRALEDCTSLTTLHLPAHLRHIGQTVFFGCNALRTITWRGHRLPGPAAYPELSASGLDLMLTLVLSGFAPMEELFMDPEDLDGVVGLALGVLVSVGYEDPALWPYVEERFAETLIGRIEHDDAAAMQKLLAYKGPLADEAVEMLLEYAVEADAKSCYLVLVNEKERRGLLGDEEKRL